VRFFLSSLLSFWPSTAARFRPKTSSSLSKASVSYLSVYKSERQKESEPRDVVAVFGAFSCGGHGRPRRRAWRRHEAYNNYKLVALIRAESDIHK
jgi:hypothetical protein